jgi:hypothetical protein
MSKNSMASMFASDPSTCKRLLDLSTSKHSAGVTFRQTTRFLSCATMTSLSSGGGT